MVVIAIGVTGSFATAATYAATTHRGYTACASSKNRLATMTSKGKCPSGFHKVSVGAAGPRGKQGKTGAQGATGLQGKPGEQGETGQQGPAGVVAGYQDTVVSVSVTQPTTYQRVASLSLPAGDYLIDMTLAVVDDDTSNAGFANTTCLLSSASQSESEAGSMQQRYGVADLAMQVDSQSTQASTVTVGCANGGVASSVHHITIQAIPVTSLMESTG
jgi:hypothetical protein